MAARLTSIQITGQTSGAKSSRNLKRRPRKHWPPSHNPTAFTVTISPQCLQPHALRFEELYTLLTEVEAILNSRPLMPLHCDKTKEGHYLTADHFLIGRPLAAPSTNPPSTRKISNLRGWNLTTRLTADLWEQWMSSYLASCAQRSKWSRPGRRLSTTWCSLRRKLASSETGPWLGWSKSTPGKMVKSVLSRTAAEEEPSDAQPAK